MRIKRSFFVSSVILILALNLFCFLHFTPSVHALDTLTIKIASSSDDAYVYEKGVSHPPWDSISIAEVICCSGYQFDRTDYGGAGLRFQNIVIPRGATITDAYINLTCSEASIMYTTNLKIAVEDADNATTFSSISNYNGRVRTSYVYWMNVSVWDTDEVGQSPSLISITQTIIDREGWVSGNSIVYFVEDAFGNSTYDREFYMYDQSTTKCASLTITYSSLPQETPAEDYVDSQSNVDSHVDVGTHSSFVSQKATDWINDSLIEANTNTTALNDSENFVDSNTSNIDSHTGHGTSNNFTAQQDSNITYNDTLTEADTAGGQSEVYVYAQSNTVTLNGFSNPAYAYNNVTTNGATNTTTAVSFWTGYLILNFTSTVKGTKIRYMVGRSSNSSSLWTTMEISVANQTGSWFTVYSATPTYAAGTYFNATFTLSTYTAMRYRFYKSTGTTSRTVTLYETQAVNASIAYNYELDYEFSWTTADFDEGNEYLCIRTGSFTGTAENLGVDVWDGSWKSISNVLSASQWNNFSISTNLTSATIYFRFIGKTESSDTAQNTWKIECSLVHTWSNPVPNYELDLEEQFASANFSRTSAELCIRMGVMDGEVLGVQWWNGNSWTTIIVELFADQWNNISVTRQLTSEAFTIRFVDGKKLGDMSQSAWNIDSCLLCTWDGIGIEPVGNSYQFNSTVGDEIIIGDPLDTAFHPKFTMNRWGDECFFKLSYDGSDKGGAVSGTQNNSVWWNTSSYDFQYCPVYTDRQQKPSGLEFVIMLKQRVTVFNFSIQSQDLVFYYQPALDHELDVSEYDSVNATHAMKNGEVMVYRPENVVGSYAVYHSSKTNNKYGSGKAFHIYRPTLIDAVGNKAWADLNIDKNVLTITLPSNFLDIATYPIRLGGSSANFGYETAGPSSATISTSLGEWISGSVFTAPADVDTATNISAALKIAVARSNNVNMAIYLHSDLSKKAQGTSTSTAMTTTLTYYTFHLSSHPTLTASADYLLAAWADYTARTISMGYDTGSENQGHIDGDNTAYSATFPDPFGEPVHSTKKWSIYCIYEVAVGGANGAPSINDLRLSSISDTSNISQIDVNTWYDWEVNVSDSGTLLDIMNVTIRLKDNPTDSIITDAAAYNRTGEYWFNYVNSSNVWQWYNSTAWTTTSDWLDNANCTTPTKTGTSGYYLFRTKLAKSAVHTATWGFSALAYDSGGNVTSKNFTAITVNAYSSLTIMSGNSTHTWINATAGVNDIVIDQGAIYFNVTTNYLFKIQAKGDGNLIKGSDYIVLGNVTIHKDTLGSSVSLTTSYADVVGLTSQALGEDVQLSLKLWLDSPANQPLGIYVYVLSIQVTEQ